MKPTEHPDKLKPFTLLYGNTCWATGESIEAGGTVYALNADAARAGEGICEAEYERLTGLTGADAPVEPTTDEQPKAKSSSKRGSSRSK